MRSATSQHGPLLRVALIVVVVLAAVALAGSQLRPALGSPANDVDLRYLEENSMLFQSDQRDETIAGEGVQWRNDFGVPEPDELVKAASVWLLYYPGSVITGPDQSVIGTWADPPFWDALEDLGVELLHTNPTQRAGGIRGREFTPTIDGWFDRISLETDPQLGTEDEYRQMVTVAGERGALIAGDLVPLHTGLGPDFRLAERGYKDYIGIYDMVEIDQADWGLLPPVEDPFGIAHVSREAAAQLKEKGYIPGIIDSADADPNANTWSGWSATPEVMGADGKPRRSVYLHVFKPAQPALNWLDPTYAARRVQFGDLARNVLDRGVKVLRLDADTFLGLEPQPDSEMASHYLTPLANVSTTDIAFATRKLGGFTYQEFAAPLATLKQFAPNGPDLSYDFFTRAEALHPLITGDVLPLRLGHHFLLQAGVPHGTLIHDLQNHDEITYQTFELGAHDDFEFEGQRLNGKRLKEQILQQMRARVGEGAAPYNNLYRPEQDGIATTFAGFIAPALGVKDPYNATPQQVALIQRGHLLVAHANAMQPGVFALAAWDIVGALPIPKESVADRTADGDWRWINRGGVDLLGTHPDVDTSAFGLPRAQALYGPLPEQLQSPDSFASQLKQMLAARKQYRLAEGTMLAVPNVGNPGVGVLVMQLPDSQDMAITALNYGRTHASIEVDLNALPSGSPRWIQGQMVRDIVADQDAGAVSDTGRLSIALDALSARTIMVPGQAPQPTPTPQPTTSPGPTTSPQPTTPASPAP